MMYQYRDEAAFSQALLRSWCNRALGYKAQRIESPLTGKGIPDLFVETADYSYWIELKREKRQFLAVHGPVSIGWREGQQTWMIEKYRASKKQRPCYTFAAFNDCIIAIPMIRRFKDDFITRADVSHVWMSIGQVVL
jgi:hypothetical protein